MKVNKMCADIKNQRGFTLSESRSGGADLIEKFFEMFFFKTRDGNLKFPRFVYPNTKFEKMR